MNINVLSQNLEQQREALEAHRADEVQKLQNLEDARKHCVESNERALHNLKVTYNLIQKIAEEQIALYDERITEAKATLGLLAEPASNPAAELT